MGDVLVKGMKMPISGAIFRVVEDIEGNKFLTSADCMNGLYYPLVEVPPHGRLVDADELESYGMQLSYLAQSVLKDGTIIHNRKLVPWKDVQTIVPAESEVES